MFFGRSEPKPESASPGELEGLATQLFERKLGQLEARAGRTVGSMVKARLDFIEACGRLEELEAQPYTEDLYFASVASIKNQKSLYAKAIRRIASDMELEGAEGGTSYARYKSILERIDGAVGEMLKTNAGFRTVLYSYSNHMASFKRSFSAMERHRDELRREVESRSAEAREYNSLREGIARLRLTLDEARVFRENADALRSSLEAGGSRQEENLEEKVLKELEAKRKEHTELSAQASRISERISLMTAPLERTSRKQDHLSLGKKRLGDFITDPINSIKDEESYRSFTALLNDLRSNVKDDKIDTKNKEGTLNSIAALLDFNLYGEITSLRSLQERKSGTAEEIRTMERTIAELKKGKEGLEKSKKDISAMIEKSEAAGKSIAPIKASVEKMFSDYYRKPVSISL